MNPEGCTIRNKKKEERRSKRNKGLLVLANKFEILNVYFKKWRILVIVQDRVKARECECKYPEVRSRHLTATVCF